MAGTAERVADEAGVPLLVCQEPPKRKRAYIDRSNARQDHCTPPDIVARVRHVFGRAPDLDPCSNPTSVVGAKREVWWKYPDVVPAGRDVVHGSGLQLVWTGAVYVNPPFDHITRWVRKCRASFEQHGAEVLLLGPARTDVRWFHAHVPSATAFCLWKGRFAFIGNKHSCPFPPLFVYWGPNVDRFTEAFGGDVGIVVRP